MSSIGELEHLLAGVVAEWHDARERRRAALKAHNERITEIEERMDALLAQLRDATTGQGRLFQVDCHQRIFAAADDEKSGERMCAKCGQFRPRTGALTCARCASLSGHALDARDPGYTPTKE